MRRIIALRDNSPVTINYIAAHLHGGQPAVNVAFPGADWRRLGVQYFHESCDRAKIGRNGKALMRRPQFVEPERDFGG
jgi:hypothetical protein